MLSDEQLLHKVRVVAAVVVLLLLAVNALEPEADVTLVGMLFGALAVLLGLASLDVMRR